MLTPKGAFSGFSTDDIAKAKDFYGRTLGIDVAEENGMLTLKLPRGQRVLLYPKEDHQPATYTALNFEVDDIDAAVDELSSAGVKFERYPSMDQDARGIMRAFGPPIAWFKDPAGNILAVVEVA